MSPADAPWRVVGASVPGPSHVVRGRDGQDAFHVVHAGPDEDPWTVLAVADGLGSRELGGVAARLAVHVAAAHAAKAVGPGRDALRRAVAGACVAAHAAVDRLPVPDGDAGCTLQVVILAGARIACGTVGDGAIVHLTDDGTLLMPVGPDPRGAGLANTTAALQQGRPCPVPRVVVISDSTARAVGVSTDGLTDVSVVAGDDGPRVAARSVLDTLVRRTAAGGDPVELCRYLAGDHELHRRTGDDLSLVVAWRDDA